MSDKDFALMKIYGIQNACITFYIPFVILVVCYVLILKVSYSLVTSSLHLFNTPKFTENVLYCCLAKRKAQFSVQLTRPIVGGHPQIRVLTD